MAEENLLNITLPSEVTTLGEATFMDCLHMTSITLSPNLTVIGPYVFARCRSLTAIHIPVSVASIGEGAFENCTQLQSITFGGTMEGHIQGRKPEPYRFGSNLWASASFCWAWPPPVSFSLNPDLPGRKKNNHPQRIHNCTIINIA